MVGKLKFTGYMPNIIECCGFIPDKWKTHNTFVNKLMHALCTPVIVGALFFASSMPEFSTMLVSSSFLLHVIGHAFEGIVS